MTEVKWEMEDVWRRTNQFIADRHCEAVLGTNEPWQSIFEAYNTRFTS